MKNLAFNIAGAISAPIILMSAFLCLDEVISKPFGEPIYNVVLSISLIIGVFFIFHFPLSKVIKALISIPYFVGGFVVMIYYSFFLMRRFRKLLMSRLSDQCSGITSEDPLISIR